MLIDNNVIDTLHRYRNIVPVISLEGNQLQTDDRRGTGIYQHLKTTAIELKKKNIFWSTSLTVTGNNFTTVTSERFIEELSDLGCRLWGVLRP